jgi:NADH:ubiquinone oxidoreductase subunit F (NADH-binding)
MASYPNTLGLLAASETVNNEATLSATPVIKATVRDLKKYMKLKNEVTGQRVLPVGYDAAMSSARDKMILDYLAGGDSESSIDFWTVGGACEDYNVVKANSFISAKASRGLGSRVWRSPVIMILCVPTIPSVYLHLLRRY